MKQHLIEKNKEKNLIDNWSGKNWIEKNREMPFIPQFFFLPPQLNSKFAVKFWFAGGKTELEIKESLN